MTASLQPKILTTLRGYGAADLRADLFAGVTVAMVAVPLSLAIAIASGATPAQGLVTAIVAGTWLIFLREVFVPDSPLLTGTPVPVGRTGAQWAHALAVLFGSLAGNITARAEQAYAATSTYLTTTLP